MEVSRTERGIHETGHAVVAMMLGVKQSQHKRRQSQPPEDAVVAGAPPRDRLPFLFIVAPGAMRQLRSA